VNHGSFQDGNNSLEAHAALPTNTSVVNSILLVMEKQKTEASEYSSP
jgi:hypothetical protein